MPTLFNNLTQDQANTCGLVLTSSGIVYTVKKVGQRWDIFVDDNDQKRAVHAVEQYFKENQINTSSDTDGGSAGVKRIYSGLYTALILLLFHIIVFMSDDPASFTGTFGASASRILDGELYRTVTALMLHSNTLHIVGNMAGIAVFGTAVCLLTGQGVGWLMILLTGMWGNLINAFVYKAFHLSIGASTAVFGAIGILAGYTFLKKIRLPDQKLKAWLPLGGGLALLGLLGSGENSDLGAHFFGFVVGIILGVVYAHIFIHPLPKRHQRWCIMVTLGIIFFSWGAALR